MAGPKDLEAKARTRNRMRPDPLTIDKDVSRPGSPGTRPDLPRYDSDATMSGSARPAGAENDQTAVPQTVDQDTGDVKPKTTGRRYRSS